MKEYVFHPFRSLKLYTSEEGKNLKDGDFSIGSVYREHGKLHFPKVENPQVSIVIPVYNQIHYTYACLVSILELSLIHIYSESVQPEWGDGADETEM